MRQEVNFLFKKKKRFLKVFFLEICSEGTLTGVLLQKTSTQLLSTKEKVNKSRAKTIKQAQVGSNEAMSKSQTNFGEHPLGYTKYSKMYFL